MYLITILRAAEEGHAGPLGLAALAQRLAVSTASVNEMVRKMAQRGLVAYEPYRGASLTEQGNAVAIRVVRSRRLWARFFADHLGFTPQEADAMACELEHVVTSQAVDRLADYLGNPRSGPLGHPIPRAGSREGPPPTVSLALIRAGIGAEVVAISAGREAVGFLAANGIEPGEHLTVVATGSEGVLVRTPRSEVHLDRSTAETVVVRAGGGSAG